MEKLARYSFKQVHGKMGKKFKQVHERWKKWQDIVSTISHEISNKFMERWKKWQDIIFNHLDLPL